MKEGDIVQVDVINIGKNPHDRVCSHEESHRIVIVPNCEAAVGTTLTVQITKSKPTYSFGIPITEVMA